MLRIAICDDSRYICEQLNKMLCSLAKTALSSLDIEIFLSGETLLRFIQEEHVFDLIFLDIELGTTTGVEVSQTIRNVWKDYISKIIFVSGASGYDRQLFSVQPFGFIEKPISEDAVQQYVTLALKVCGLDKHVFRYKIGNDFYQVELRDILYFESQLRKVKIVTTTGTNFFHASLSAVQTQLPRSFISPHGSFVTNFSHIENISKNSITMSDGTVLPISQRNMKQVRALQIQVAKEKRDASL